MVKSDSALVSGGFIKLPNRRPLTLSADLPCSHFSSACIRSGVAILGRPFQDALPMHRKYPRGWLQIANMSTFFSDNFPTLASGGFLINSTVPPVGDCQNGGRQYFAGRDVVFPAWNPAAASKPQSRATTRKKWRQKGLPIVEWEALESYKQCFASLLPRFVREIGGGTPQAPRSTG